MKRKIKIGICACLAGEYCRYDGKSKLDAGLKKFLEKEFEIIPICPEAECGMSIPREPAVLIVKDGQKRFLTLNSNEDLTEKLTNWIKEKTKFLKQKKLSGFVFKSKSPSCALHDAKIYTGKIEEKALSFEAGLFAEAVMGIFPGIVVGDENYFSTETGKIDFLRRVKKPGKKK